MDCSSSERVNNLENPLTRSIHHIPHQSNIRNQTDQAKTPRPDGYRPKSLGTSWRSIEDIVFQTTSTRSMSQRTITKQSDSMRSYCAWYRYLNLHLLVMSQLTYCLNPTSHRTRISILPLLCSKHMRYPSVAGKKDH